VEQLRRGDESTPSFWQRRRDAGFVLNLVEPVVWPDDAEAAVEFLVSNEWPYHSRLNLSREQAAKVSLGGDDTISFWVKAGGETIGLIRVFDLDDLDVGSPLLDIRIAGAHRGRGVGTAAVSWVLDHLFTTYRELHRIEATTRHDNVPMHRVFDRCGFRLEGQMIEAWTNADGSRADTWTYAILRREWSART
jgi:RimJ/RimL family protein N-acetyltransferase